MIWAPRAWQTLSKHLAAVLAVLAGLVGCSDSTDDLAAQSARLDSMLGAVRVRVAPVENVAIVPQAEVTGVVAAYRKATVAAEVSGCAQPQPTS